jgi:hypothetical protein
VVLLGTVAANIVLWLVVRPGRLPVEVPSADKPALIAVH